MINLIIDFTIWTMLVLISYFLVRVKLTGDETYIGSKIEFQTSRDIKVDAKSTFQASSNHFFELRNNDGEIIKGIPVSPPSGWRDKLYFVVEPKVISRGYWEVEVHGKITATITNDETTTVRLTMKDQKKDWVLLIINTLFILIGIAGAWFINTLLTNP
jgi:hypothetical protein